MPIISAEKEIIAINLFGTSEKCQQLQTPSKNMYKVEMLRAV